MGVDVVLVNVGVTVIWHDDDLVPYTATSARKSFDSGGIEPGKSWKYLVNKKSSYSYICAYHPTIKAELIVP
jgi:plastocyanin